MKKGNDKKNSFRDLLMHENKNINRAMALIFLFITIAVTLASIGIMNVNSLGQYFIGVIVYSISVWLMITELFVLESVIERYAFNSIGASLFKLISLSVVALPIIMFKATFANATLFAIILVVISFPLVARVAFIPIFSNKKGNHTFQMFKLNVLGAFGRKFNLSSFIFKDKLNETVVDLTMTDIEQLPQKQYTNSDFYGKSIELTKKILAYKEIIEEIRKVSTISNDRVKKDIQDNVETWVKDLKSSSSKTYYKAVYGLESGFDGETRLFKVLKSLGIKFYDNVVCKASNGEKIEVDALFIYNDVLYTVEAKNYEAPKIVLTSGGSLIRQDKYGNEHQMDTLGQVLRHKNILKRIVGDDIKIVSIIAFTNEQTIVEDNLRNEDLIVTNIKALSFLFGNKHVDSNLSKEKLSIIEKSITEGDMFAFPDVDYLKNKWNENVSSLRQQITPMIDAIKNIDSFMDDLQNKEMKEIYKNHFFGTMNLNQIKENMPDLFEYLERYKDEKKRLLPLLQRLEKVLTEVA